MDMPTFVLSILNSYSDKYVVNKFIIDKRMATKETIAEIKKDALPRREGGNGGDFKKAKIAKLKYYRNMVRSLMSLLRKRKQIETIDFKYKPASFVKKMIITTTGMAKNEIVAHKITKFGIKVLHNPTVKKPKVSENTFVNRMR